MPCGHRAPVGEHLLHPRMQLEAGGGLGELERELLEVRQRDRGVVRIGPRALLVGRPVDGHRRLVIREHGLVGVQALVHRRAIRRDHRVGFLLADHARLHQRVGVQAPRARMLVDLLVHERLRDHRLVGLVVAEAPEADEIDEHVAVILLAIFHRELDREQAHLGIVRIDVEDRAVRHLRDVGAVERAARVARVGRGEADLVVDDDVDRAAGVVAARLGHVEAFLHDALSRDGGVAVDQHRQHLVALGIAPAVLARAHRAFHHGIHRLEVRGIEREGEVHRAAGRDHVRGEALVILHVARGELLRVLALELREELARHLAQRVDEHVEAPAMRHADDRLLHPRGAGDLDEVIEHRRQRVAALAGEALLADVARVQVALERLRRGEALEDLPALLRAVGGPRADGLEPRLDEALHARVGDVHVLRAERAAVGVLQRLHDVAQAHAVRSGPERADVELGVEVRVGEAVSGEVEVGDVLRLLALQRIELRLGHAQRAVLADQLEHLHLLVHGGGVHHRARDAPALAELDERLDDRRMRDVRRAAAQGIEIRAPVRGHRAGIREVALVLLLDERHVAAEEGAGGFEFLHRAHGSRTSLAG